LNGLIAIEVPRPLPDELTVKIKESEQAEAAQPSSEG